MSQFERAILVVAIGIVFTAVSGLMGQVVSTQTSPTVHGPGQPPATQPVITGPAPKIRFDEATYNFPDAWSGAVIEHDFIVHNDGDKLLEMTEVRAGCGCTVVEYDKKIEPGKQGKVKSKLSTNYMKGKLIKKIFVTCNDPRNPRTELTLQGTVKERIVIDPQGGANWGRIDANSEVKEQKIKLTNNVETPIKIEMATPEQHNVFKAKINEVEAGKVYEIVILPQPPFPTGSTSTELTFKTGLKEQPTIAIRCSMFAPPELEIIPTAITLGAPLTQPMPRPVQVRFNGKGAIKVVKAEASDPTIKAEITERTAGREYQVMVTLPAGLNIPADKPAELKITTDYEKQKEITIPIQMRAQPAFNPQQQPGMTVESLIGRPSPMVPLRTTDGREVQVGGNTGRVMVIDFWATWCRHSRRQLPVLQRLSQAYGRRGVDFMAVSIDRFRSATETADIAKQHGANLPIQIDSNHVARQTFGVTALPMLILVSKSGIVEFIHRGIGQDEAGIRTLEETVSAELEALLDGKTRADVVSKPQIPAVFSTVDVAQPAPKTPKAWIESLQQDTGRHKPGELVKHVIRLRNDGMEVLTISGITAAEGIKIDSNYEKSIPTSRMTSITVEFNTPAQPGEFGRSISIATNDPSRPTMVVEVTGQVRPLVEVDPATGVDFSRKPRIHSMPRLATLTYNGKGEVKYGKIESTSPKFKGEVEAIPNTPYAKVTVYSVPPFEKGENKGVLRIETGVQEQPIVEVPVTLYLPERIEVTPAEILLSPARRLQEGSVTIANNGEKSFHVLEVSSSNDQLRTQFYPEPDGMSYRLKITFPASYTPSPAGDKITIRTDDQEFKEIAIPIKAAAEK